MDTAASYRKNAARARRLARFVTDPDVVQSFEQLAREYDEIADDLERRAASTRDQRD